MHQHHSIQAILSHFFTLWSIFVTNLHFVMLVILAVIHQIRYKALFIDGNQKYLILDVNIVMRIVLLG